MLIVKGTCRDTVAFKWAEPYYEVQFECSTMAHLFNDLLEPYVIERNISPLSVTWESSSDSSDDDDSSDNSINNSDLAKNAE